MLKELKNLMINFLRNLQLLFATAIVIATSIAFVLEIAQMVNLKTVALADLLLLFIYLEVFVDAPMVVVEKRDTKGLYAKARAGLLPNFTGVDSPYEIPTNPNLRVESSVSSVVECLDQIVAELVRKSFL